MGISIGCALYLCELLHITGNAVEILLLCYIFVATKRHVAAKAAKVIQMPGIFLSERVFSRKYQLIAASTPWIELLTEMPAAVIFPLMREVDEVDQKLLAMGTSKDNSITIEQTNLLRHTEDKKGATQGGRPLRILRPSQSGRTGTHCGILYRRIWTWKQIVLVALQPLQCQLPEKG